MATSLLYWVVISLLAVAFLNDPPYLTLGVAIFGGVFISYQRCDKLGILTQPKLVKSIEKPNAESVGNVAFVVPDIRLDKAQGWRWLISSVADHQLYLTGFVAPFLLFANRFPYWLQITAWILFVLPWFCRLVTYRHLTHFALSNPPFLGLLAMMAVGFWVSIDRPRSLDYINQLSVGVGIFYGLANLRPTRLNPWLPIAGLIIMATGLALTAPLIVTWSSSRFFLEQVYSQLSPVTSETLDANILAAILSMALLVLVALVWRGRFGRQLAPQFPTPLRWLKIVIGFAGLVLFVALGFTQSRGAAIALAIGWFALLILYKRKLLLALPVAVFGTYLVTRAIGFGAMSDLLLSAGPAKGWTGRQEVWSSATRMLRAMPFTGIGMGTFSEIQPLLFPFVRGWQPTHAHNLFLQVGVDLGIPGLVAYVAILTSCLLVAWQAWRTFRDFGQRDLEALAAGVFASLIAMITHGLVDAPLWGTKPSIVAWFFMGLAAMLYVHSHKSFHKTVRAPDLS
jgi:putative inorganic carbon (HCO3(-)) transporter